MRVALYQLDGKWPNLALARIAAHHRTQGDTVELIHCHRPERAQRGLFDQWDRVYASLIFTKSRPTAAALKRAYPDATIGGTGWDLGKPAAMRTTVESLGITSLAVDYSLWPAFRSSLGFSQRGCRYECDFCDVPAKEGKVQSVATIADIWRGEPWPREIILLDNDFFGQPCWRDRIEELRAGRFKVSFSQGINVRLLSDEHCAAVAQLDLRDDKMHDKAIHCAWDDSADERTVFRGLERLVKHGLKPRDIRVYMLIGFRDSPADRERRRARLREFGAVPYPMPYERTPELVAFQSWCIRNADKLGVPLEEYAAMRRLSRKQRRALPMARSDP